MTELAAAILLVVTGFLFSLELRRRRIAETRLQEALASVEQQVATAVAGAEAARQAAEEASELKDEFLNTASHELRTPLNAIVGWVRLLQSGALEDQDKLKQAVDAIERNARVQTRLIDDLLDVSRLMRGRVSLTVAPVNLRSIVDAAVDTLRPAAAAKHVAVDVEATRDVLPVIGDEHRLQQIVWNLLANALKYTDGGGRVIVSIGADGDNAVLQVRDTGEGIDPGFLPYVFEPFRQGTSITMRRGLGLGLAIARRLIDLHGGRISAESGGVGKGSTFTVSLPLADVQPPASSSAVEPEVDQRTIFDAASLTHRAIR